MSPIDPFDAWVAAVDERHRADLEFAEVRRGVQALSSVYVERRDRLRARSPFSGAGKRAAFASFYGPLHFLAVRHVVREIGAATPQPRRIVDLGCGTGVAGAAWALEAGGAPAVSGYDNNAWAIAEARWTYRILGIRGRPNRADINGVRLSRDGAILLGFAVNELDPGHRRALLGRLLAAVNGGAALLVVEPISRRISPWWNEWAKALGPAGAVSTEWRFRPELPEPVRRLDRAAGLDHSTLTARSLWVAGRG